MYYRQLLQTLLYPSPFQVYLSHRHPLLPHDLKFPLDEVVRPPVKLFTASMAILESGEELSIDAILLCTGYQYSFPFLSEECQPKNEDGRLYPLYKHVLHVEYPTLFFIGICQFIPHFRLHTLQIEFAVASLLGRAHLPGREGMLRDIEADYAWRTQDLGMPPNQAHHMWPCMQFIRPYQQSLLELVDDPNLLHTMQEKHMDYLDRLFTCYGRDPKHYRSRKYPMGKTKWEDLPGHELYPLTISKPD